MTRKRLLQRFAVVAAPVAVLAMPRLSHSAPAASPIAAPSADLGPGGAVELRSGSAQWWTQFEDPRLNALVERSLGQNLDVQAARLRISESQALTQNARAPLMPTLSWDSGINLAPTDSLGFQFGGTSGAIADPNAEPPPDVYWSGSSVLNARLELDVTGRNMQELKASRHDRDAARADLASSEISVAASVATAYYDLVAARARATIVEEQIETVGELLALTQARFADGLAQGTDLLQQRQQLAATEALRPQAAAQVRAFGQQLAVLLGESPNTAHDSGERLPLLLPAEPPDFDGGFEGRPDLVAAQARADSAQRREKVARRQFAPTLALSGTAGVQAIAITEVREQWYWGAGASLSVPLFNGGRTLATLRQRQAQTQRSRNELERLGLEAQRQVADAYAATQERAAVLDATRAELEFADASYQAIRARYLEGELDVLNLLTALTGKQQAQLNLISAQRDLVVAHIDLQRALAPSAVNGGANQG